jgi:dihydrofolate reductase
MVLIVNNMKKITVFNYVSIDGFFAGSNSEMDWFKIIKKDDEWDEYTHRQAKPGNNTLIFGRTTYKMMRSWWSTATAIQNDPDMAKAVNESPKIVFSKALESVEEEPQWKNVRLFHGIEQDLIRKLKDSNSLISIERTT